jgi:hypothetical protein
MSNKKLHNVKFKELSLMQSEEHIRRSLVKELKTRGAQKRISQALEVSATTVMRWGDGETIPASMQKLLRLYLFGEIPFSMLRDPDQASSLLEFSEDEWRLITILAARAGQEPRAWIRSQILAYISPTTKTNTARRQGRVRIVPKPNDGQSLHERACKSGTRRFFNPAHSPHKLAPIQRYDEGKLRDPQVPPYRFRRPCRSRRSHRHRA